MVCYTVLYGCNVWYVTLLQGCNVQYVTLCYRDVMCGTLHCVTGM